MKSFYVAGVFIALVASSAAAEVVIDQQYVGPSVKSYYFDYPGDYMAQTFTLLNSGQITSIGLQISRPRPPYPTSPLQFVLTRTNAAGEPVVANVLAAANINSSEVTHDYSGLPMVEIDLRNQHVQVQSGDQLAIVLSSSELHYNWNTSFSDQISGGRFFVYSPNIFGPQWFDQWRLDNPADSWDAGYRVTVNAIPEPSTALFVTLSTIASIAFRLRATQKHDSHRCIVRPAARLLSFGS